MTSIGGWVSRLALVVCVEDGCLDDRQQAKACNLESYCTHGARQAGGTWLARCYHAPVAFSTFGEAISVSILEGTISRLADGTALRCTALHCV